MVVVVVIVVIIIERRMNSIKLNDQIVPWVKDKMRSIYFLALSRWQGLPATLSKHEIYWVYVALTWCQGWSNNEWLAELWSTFKNVHTYAINTCTFTYSDTQNNSTHRLAYINIFPQVRYIFNNKTCRHFCWYWHYV